MCLHFYCKGFKKIEQSFKIYAAVDIGHLICSKCCLVFFYLQNAALEHPYKLPLLFEKESCNFSRVHSAIT